MSWSLDKQRPICPQIFEKLCVMIATGQMKPNEKLPSVRETAVGSGVNPNTVQKAYEQLEVSGLIYSVRSSGWYVGENAAVPAQNTVGRLMEEKTRDYFSAMGSLGKSAGETKRYVGAFAAENQTEVENHE